ncbi:hypothetical protein D9756_003562 [Leucocoprinus leucothites]|uniref:Uncharacterized protein n=1 Tax=Leucocoprinus leucothites TaxID=201217 RepID=A0A8H5G6W9_9AGAR|nr:hypothetical protein D9756_003562 [Leucoagaricus leucothites]
MTAVPTSSAFGASFPPTQTGVLDKVQEDKWSSTPPQITSYLTYSRAEPSDDQSRHRYMSSPCGLGWRFQLDETFHYQKSPSNHLAQELVGKTRLRLVPHFCSSMPLILLKVIVKIMFPRDEGKAFGVQTEEFSSLPIRSESALGTYMEPAQHEGPVQLEVTLTFDPITGLALPTTPSMNTQKALHHSLDGPTFVDTKFYLFSARVNGRPAHPKPVYAKSLLLTDSSNYMRDLLSPDSSFTGGSPCDLRLDVPEEIAKLDADVYDYDDDSDLEESEGPTTTSKGKAPENPSEIEKEGDPGDQQEATPASHFIDGRAFAINGTAYKTWKAFLFYSYTNSIYFNKLKSQRTQKSASFNWVQSTKSNPEFVTCSPKSMYRFADYADLPELKALAKEGISKSLSRFNIVDELFSVFTYKYQEIIELEVDFLVRNFTGSVRRDFDEMLQMIVLGTQTHCFRVLAFTIKRLLGDDARTAWKAVDGTERNIGRKNKKRQAETASSSSESDLQDAFTEKGEGEEMETDESEEATKDGAPGGKNPPLPQFGSPFAGASTNRSFFGTPVAKSPPSIFGQATLGNESVFGSLARDLRAPAKSPREPVPASTSGEGRSPVSVKQKKKKGI